MKLADLRKLSIKQQTRIRFPLRNGLECVIDEHGIAAVPGLRAIPDFNLEEELEAARDFVLEPLDQRDSRQRAAGPTSREALARMLAPVGTESVAEHEDE